ncbi:hypothetical protein V6N13_103219 [Hibiscus sabdariffa]|uniref:RNase H type-1 domain-containing protein n=1 Tax=Hibiscus sabdariffa TaxID=183260 RepID=A0ABR2C5C4_9ROSI
MNQFLKISGVATYFQGSMKFDADRSILFSCPLGVMNITTAELRAIKMGMEVQIGFARQQCNELADALAKAETSRPALFKAWW